MSKKAIRLTFPKARIKEPVIYNLGHKFKIVTNIKRANITHDEGWVVLELDGEQREIDNGINWLMSLGIKIAPVGVEEN